MATRGEIVLTELVEPDGDQFAAYCLELGTASCGDTIEEAFTNLEEAIWVHLNELEAIDERDEFSKRITSSLWISGPGCTRLVSRLSRLGRC